MMMSALSTGNSTKAVRFRSLMDDTGRYLIMAMDHRGNLVTALTQAAARVIEENELTTFKSVVTDTLAGDCSAVLLDPQFGLPATHHRPPGCGLLLAYERSGYDNARPGRRPDLIVTQSVRRLQAEGADAIKILLHYSEAEAPEVNDEKRSFIERVGAECAALEAPFVLEIVTYDPDGLSTPREAVGRRTRFIRDAVHVFSRSEYGVDVLKLELPVPARLVVGEAGAEAPAVDRREAHRLIRETLDSVRLPVVFLSGGASTAEYVAGLRLVAEAGVAFQGALCGRAIWNGGIAAYAQASSAALGERRLREWLRTHGRDNLESVRGCVAQTATPRPRG